MACLSSQLMSLMPGFKHFGYQYEYEHRLYEDELLVNGEAYPFKISEERKFTKNGKNRLRSPKFNNGDICEIWVGPCNNKFEASKNEIEDILKSSGYDLKQVEIKQSEMPYRIK